MTDQDQGRALRRAILDAPEDDAVRLVYADWLEEAGETRRAQYIRFGVRHAPERESSFVGMHDSTGWFPGTHEFGEHATFFVRRGFISRVECPLADWLKHGPALVQSHPLTRVDVYARRPAKGKFGQRPIWELSGRDYWVWKGDRAESLIDIDASYLPHDIFMWLDGYVSPHTFGTFRQYLTEADALDALSRACLTHARKKAAQRKTPRGTWNGKGTIPLAGDS